MNRKELEALLKNNKIRQDMYWLHGGLPNETYCIDVKDGMWQVYYSERGQRSGMKVFDNENDACNCFYNWVMADDTIKE